MYKYLAIFQVGPVQEFIQTAKKTSDYWSGSFLLSYFCATAIKAVGQPAVVFPEVLSNPLFAAVTHQNNDLPWPAGIPPEAYRPTIPNRMLCLFEQATDPSKILEDAQDQVQKQWETIARKVFEKFPDALTKSWVFRDIWDRQVRSPFEILYVWRKWDDTQGEIYSEAYHSTEALMGARKASRWFEAGETEEGHKCSLCGIREALHTVGKTTRKDIRKVWEVKIRKHDLKYQFRESETLCAICTIKRLAPDFVFSYKRKIPSTSTVAVAATTKLLLDNNIDVSTFAGAVRKVADGVGEPPESAPVPALDAPHRANNITLDGNWYYDDFYQNLKSRHSASTTLIEIASKALKEKVLPALKRSAPDTYLPPCKYFAVLAADGDSMGKVLGNAQSPEEHKKFSKVLAAFSVFDAFRILQEEALGFAVYFGGDEGVGFVALEDLFKVMRALRRQWEESVMKPMNAMDVNPPPTMSIGVAIAHHQDGLRGVIAEAHAALVEAKQIKFRDTTPAMNLLEKDAFCVHLVRRSSGTFTSRARWWMPVGSEAIETLAMLEQLKTAYRSELLSPSWLMDLRREEKAIGDPPEKLDNAARGRWFKDAGELCRKELTRILSRHFIHQQGVLGRKAEFDRLLENLLQLHDALRNQAAGTDANTARFADFVGLMDLARFVEKGGGR